MIYCLLTEMHEGKINDLTTNQRHNLGQMAALVLDDPRQDIREKAQTMLIQLWGDGRWTPDQIPGGWKEFCCCVLSKANDDWIDTSLLCELIRMGHRTGDARCRREFREILNEICLSAPSTVKVALAESALWRETALASEVAEGLFPDGKGLDREGERRWQRQFIREHGEAKVREYPDLPPAKPEGGKNKNFWNLLWESLNADIADNQAAQNQSRKGTKTVLTGGREIVFQHPHRPGTHGVKTNVPAEREQGTPCLTRAFLDSKTISGC